jgi:hypothetical protein
MALFTLTINNLSPALEKKFQEVERIKRYTEYALKDLGGANGGQTSGNITDIGGATVGSWTYVPQAAT